MGRCRNASIATLTTSEWAIPDPNKAALDILPKLAPGKTKRVILALELPFALTLKYNPTIYQSLSWFTLAADVATELAVRYINNSTRILPNHKVDIIRVNNYNPDPSFTTSGGYAMNEVYQFYKNYSDSDCT
jgi:hypothetical protein